MALPRLNRTLLLVVDRKMSHPKNMWSADDTAVITKEKKVGQPRMDRAELLAVVLYTGCDCNYAMCAAERDGDYKTWQWFSALLFLALTIDVDRGRNRPRLFSGKFRAPVASVQL